VAENYDPLDSVIGIGEGPVDGADNHDKYIDRSGRFRLRDDPPTDAAYEARQLEAVRRLRRSSSTRAEIEQW
jgi:hypothetical protein